MPVVRHTSKGYGSSAFDGVAWSHQSSTVQTEPFVMGNFDAGRIRNAVSFGNRGNPNTYVHSLLDYNMPWDDFQTESANGARARLMSKLQPARAAMGVNLAQLDQALGMIAKRSKQLHRAWQRLRAFDLPGMLKELSIGTAVKLRNGQDYYSRKRRRWVVKKEWTSDLESTWLEFTFGWVPLVTDLYNAADVLQREFPPVPVRASCKAGGVRVYDRTYERITAYKTVVTRMHAGIVITNPNLALLNSLGLLNPAAVAWDIIPWSFVIDWFMKINKYVNTLNDMAGFSFTDASTTVIVSVEVDVYYKPFPWIPSGTRSGGGRRVIRANSIPAPKFNPRFQLPMPSLWLAATSTALLSQKFGK